MGSLGIPTRPHSRLLTLFQCDAERGSLVCSFPYYCYSNPLAGQPRLCNAGVTGYIVGTFGTICKSTNSGSTWAKLQNIQLTTGGHTSSSISTTTFRAVHVRWIVLDQSTRTLLPCTCAPYPRLASHRVTEGANHERVNREQLFNPSLFP